MPERVRSLTVLDTVVAVEHFTRPAVMEPFAHRGLGELWLASMWPRLFPPLMRAVGVAKQDQVTDAELAAYIPLLRGDDGGRAFREDHARVPAHRREGAPVPVGRRR